MNPNVRKKIEILIRMLSVKTCSSAELNLKPLYTLLFSVTFISEVKLSHKKGPHYKQRLLKFRFWCYSNSIWGYSIFEEVISLTVIIALIVIMKVIMFLLRLLLTESPFTCIILSETLTWPMICASEQSEQSERALRIMYFHFSGKYDYYK